MILARNKNGQIGRMIPGTGMQANVETANMGDHRGSVYISARSLEADENYYAQKEREESYAKETQRLKDIAIRQAEIIQHRKRAQDVEAFQRLARLDPMNEKLKLHYARRAGMGESDIVSDGLLRNPADFSSSGANPEIVAAEAGKRAIAWRADWRQHLIVGNPLTRDGEYGPAVTDYDRYVQGTDMNQLDVVNIRGGGAPDRLVSFYSETMDDELPIAGGTMLGRWNGQTAPAGMGRQAMSGLPTAYPAGTRRGIPRGLPGRFNSDQGMGEWSFPSWDSITTGISSGINTGVNDALANAPKDLLNSLIGDLTGSGQTATVTGNTITVQRPVTGAVNTVSQSIGLPPWAVYSGLGLIGVGVLFMVIKAVKS